MQLSEWKSLLHPSLQSPPCQHSGFSHLSMQISFMLSRTAYAWNYTARSLLCQVLSIQCGFVLPWFVVLRVEPRSSHCQGRKCSASEFHFCTQDSSGIHFNELVLIIVTAISTKIWLHSSVSNILNQ